MVGQALADVAGGSGTVLLKGSGHDVLVGEKKEEICKLWATNIGVIWFDAHGPLIN
jgi:arginase family enzyme